MTDILEDAGRTAMMMLSELPKEYPGAELSIAGIEDQEVWLGFGYLVGKGLAAYRGSYSFRLTDAGRDSLKTARENRSENQGDHLSTSQRLPRDHGV